MSNKNPFVCYFPMSMCELDGTDLKFMLSVMYKMNVTRRIENIEFKLEDAKGVRRRSFFNAMKSLTANSYLKISKLNKTTYAISLNNETGHYTDQDIQYLTRPFKSSIPEIHVHVAEQQEPQVKQLPISKICESGNHADCMSANRPGTCGCECHKNKVTSFM